LDIFRSFKLNSVFVRLAAQRDQPLMAAAPPTISDSSLVIAA
jgi:hypothetical protein